LLQSIFFTCNLSNLVSSLTHRETNKQGLIDMLDFTQEITLSSDCLDLNLLIREGTDLDDTFKAWCLDEKEFIKVNGWMFSIVEE
jgi:hypothetical protein